MSGDWNNPLFKCFETPITCAALCCVPGAVCCYQGASTKATQGETKDVLRALACIWCCACIGVGYNRSLVREKLNINGSLIKDIIFACICPCCTMVQEWRAVTSNKGLKEDECFWKACS